MDTRIQKKNYGKVIKILIMKDAIMYRIYYLIPFIFLPFLENINDIYNRVVYYQPREYFSLGLSIAVLLYLVIKKQIKFRKKDILLYAFLLILLVGQIYTIDKFYGSRTIIGYVIFIIAYYYFSILKKKKEIYYSLFIIGVVQAMIGILQKIGLYYKIIQVKELTERAKIIGTIGHVNQFSHFLSIIFISSLALFLFEKNKLKKMLLFLGEILIFQTILFTKTRASLLALTIAFIILLIYGKKLIMYKNNKKQFLLLITVFIVQIFFNYSSFETRIKSSNNFESGSVAERVNIWKKSLLMISGNPILGSGTGSFFEHEIKYMNNIQSYIQQNPKMTQKEKSQLQNDYKIVGHTHNEYLQFYVENGIFAFLLILGIAIKIIYDFIKNKKYKNLISFLPLLVILIISLFSFPLHMIHNLLLGAIYLGLEGQRIEDRE